MKVTTHPPDARDPMSPMSRLLLLLALAVAALPPLAHGAAPHAPRNDALASCSWDRPGRNPFMGDVVAAVDRYRDIPTPVREKLKQRMRTRQYEDLVDIRRDEIKGKFEYAATIRDMHFGEGSVCRQVTRERWTDQMHERGLVYCEAEHCILVPTVCRNVSRITMAAAPATGTASASGTGDESPPAPEPVVVASSEGEEVHEESFEALSDPETPRGSSSGYADALYADLALPPMVPAQSTLYPPFTVPIFGIPSGGSNDPGREHPPFIPGPPGWVPGLPDVPTAPVPEPAQWAQMALGACLLGAIAWKRRRARR